VTGPDDLRARFAGHSAADLVAELVSLRPRPGRMIGGHTLLSLRELGRRVAFPDGQLPRPDALIVPLVTARAAGLLALYGVGPDTAATLLIAAGDHPGRLRSAAAGAPLGATAPIPASSGKVTRHRPGPGGGRQAGHARCRIVITRLSSCPPARAYAGRRGKQGLPGRRSSAASRGPSPARPAPACAQAPADAQAPGAAWPPNRLPHSAGLANDSPAAPGPHPGLLGLT
jgi:transposase